MSYTIEVGDRVRVIAYGYGARRVDCGRVGTVTGFTAKRVRVTLDNTSDGQPGPIGAQCLSPYAGGKP